MNRVILAIALFAASAFSEAAYNANMAGELEGFYVYAEGDYIYFRLKNQPSSHPTCSPVYFVIPETVSSDRRKAMLSRLSLAYATKEIVTIGYDNTGDCAHGYLRVYRVG
ncbi:MAG: hypothetical protein IDH49_10995 [Gammaproteobacteria bacterium]|nr:hypothetical protein [Gammaproteobacteria bacterium]